MKLPVSHLGIALYDEKTLTSFQKMLKSCTINLACRRPRNLITAVVTVSVGHASPEKLDAWRLLLISFWESYLYFLTSRILIHIKRGIANLHKITVLSRASAHGHSQLKHQKLRVGGYTQVVLEWFNYPRASTYPRCEVSCLGTELTSVVALPILCRASPTVEKAASC